MLNFQTIDFSRFAVSKGFPLTLDYFNESSSPLSGNNRTFMAGFHYLGLESLELFLMRS